MASKSQASSIHVSISIEEDVAHVEFVLIQFTKCILYETEIYARLA